MNLDVQSVLLNRGQNENRYPPAVSQVAPPSPPHTYMCSGCCMEKIFFRSDFYDQKNLNEKKF
jgi:hypothetical protein